MILEFIYIITTTGFIRENDLVSAILLISAFTHLAVVRVNPEVELYVEEKRLLKEMLKISRRLK